MYNYISQKIVDYFISKSIIPEGQKDEYSYGFEVLISSVLSTLLLLIISLALKKIGATCLFILGFSIARLTCGGYHAKRHLTCLLATLANYFIFLCSIFTLDFSSIYILLIIITIISFFVITLLSPIDTINHQLTKPEKIHHKIRSMILITIFTLISVYCIITFKKIYEVYYLGFGIASVSVSLIISKIQQHKKGR